MDGLDNWMERHWLLSQMGGHCIKVNNICCLIKIYASRKAIPF